MQSVLAVWAAFDPRVLSTRHGAFNLIYTAAARLEHSYERSDGSRGGGGWGGVGG